MTLCRSVGVDSAVLNDSFSKDSVESWDSVHQLNIIALLEESFDVMFDPEDIMEFTSYGKGREILKNTKSNFKGQGNGKMGN